MDSSEGVFFVFMKDNKKIFIIVFSLALLAVVFFLNIFSFSKVKETPPVVTLGDVSLPKDNKTNTAILQIEDGKYEIEIQEGGSVYDFMNKLRAEGQIDFKDKNYSGIGKFIYEINGVQGEGGKYWIYYINGKKMSIGVSGSKVNSGDVVSWKYEKDINLK